jgi:hypothetical protein
MQIEMLIDKAREAAALTEQDDDQQIHTIFI